MIDPFVILAPVLLLAVIALLRFLGCGELHGVAEEPSLSISPESATAGGPIFTLTVNGAGFVNDDDQSVVQWKGNDRYTTFFDATKLTATILASDIATPGPASVTVINKHPDGSSDLLLGPTTFTINPVSVPVPAPVTVTFDNLGPAPSPPGYAALHGIVGMDNNLDFGLGPDVWFWKGSGIGNTIFIGPANDAAFHMGSFKFHNGPRVLKSVSVSYTGTPPPASGTITLKDDNIPPQTASMSINPGPAQIVPTNWDPLKPSAAVTVTSDVGWDLEIDKIVYYGPV